MSMMPSALTSRLALDTVSGAARCVFGVTAMTPEGQFCGLVSAQVIRWTLSVPMLVRALVPAKVKATVDVGTLCQLLKAAVRASIARCSESGDKPPAQVGLPLLQLLM